MDFQLFLALYGYGIMALGKFGRYEIKSEVGRGGMATVYYAYDPNFEREVAIKVLPSEFLHDPQFRVRFDREAKTVALIEHPAIVPVYDFGEEDGQPYIVMRFMAGGSLADKLKKGALRVSQVIQMLSVLAPALDAAHAKGIIHRDLKPGNILFDQYDNPYISDFGIARLINNANATMTGSAILGTPAYMSPEQIQGDRILDGRSDIYALGVILFQMLTGVMPFNADTPAKMMMAHLLEPVPAIHTANTSLPPAMDAVVDLAMAKDPTQRFQTASEMATMLQAVASGKVIAPLVQTRVAGTPSTKRSPYAVPGPVVHTPTPPPVVLPHPQAEPSLPTKKRGVPMWVWIAGGLVIVGALVVFVVGGGFAIYTMGRNHIQATITPQASLVAGLLDTPVVQATEPLLVNNGELSPEKTSPVDSNPITVSSIKTGLETLINYRIYFKYEILGKNDKGDVVDETEVIETKRITASGDYYYHRSGNAVTADKGGYEIYWVDGVSYLVKTINGGSVSCFNMSKLGDSSINYTQDKPDAIVGSLTHAVLVANGETINNVATDHYQLDASSFQNGAYNNGNGDLWLAQNGGYVVKLSFHTNGKGMISGQMIDGLISWAYDATNINHLDGITLPKECQGQ